MQNQEVGNKCWKMWINANECKNNKNKQSDIIDKTCVLKTKTTNVKDSTMPNMENAKNNQPNKSIATQIQN